MLTPDPDFVNALIEAHYGFFSLWPGYERVALPGATVVADTRLPGAYRNHVGLIQATADQADDLLEWGTAELRHRGRSPSFQFSPVDYLPDYETRLIKRGFKKIGAEAWMVSEGRPDMPTPNPAIEVATFGVGDEVAIQTYIDCYNLCFGIAPHVWPQFGAGFRQAQTQATAIHYLARIEGLSAGVMSLFYHDGLACVYNVGTFPAFRGQRLATTLLLRLLADAADLRCRVVYLQTLYEGRARPMYERVGFRTLFVRARYELLA